MASPARRTTLALNKYALDRIKAHEDARRSAEITKRAAMQPKPAPKPRGSSNLGALLLSRMNGIRK